MLETAKPKYLPLKILAVAIAYTMLGKLGVLLAIPPGYATPIFVPSGIALAAVLSPRR